MSRNKREGRYHGWSTGRHVRLQGSQRVDAWNAWCVFTIRAERKWAESVIANRAAMSAGDAKGASDE